LGLAKAKVYRFAPPTTRELRSRWYSTGTPALSSATPS
jgi:hypothetical protein